MARAVITILFAAAGNVPGCLCNLRGCFLAVQARFDEHHSAVLRTDQLSPGRAVVVHIITDSTSASRQVDKVPRDVQASAGDLGGVIKSHYRHLKLPADLRNDWSCHRINVASISNGKQTRGKARFTVRHVYNAWSLVRKYVPATAANLPFNCTQLVAKKRHILLLFLKLSTNMRPTGKQFWGGGWGGGG